MLRILELSKRSVTPTKERMENVQQWPAAQDNIQPNMNILEGFMEGRFISTLH